MLYKRWNLEDDQKLELPGVPKKMFGEVCPSPKGNFFWDALCIELIDSLTSFPNNKYSKKIVRRQNERKIHEICQIRN